MNKIHTLSLHRKPRFLSRRRFLGTSALAWSPLAWSLAEETRAHPVPVPEERRFEMGTVTYNLAREWTLDELITNCEKTGFKAVELRTTHRHGVEPELSPSQRQAVRKRFEESAVTLLCLGTACEYHSPDPEEVRRNIELSRRFVELASDVGARGIKVRPNGLPRDVPVQTTLRQIGRALQQVGEFAERHGVEIWVEVHGSGTSHPPHMKQILEECGHPRVGVTWNCNQTDLKEGRLEPYFSLLQPHIRNVHIHDLYGGYPYRELFALLRAAGYGGYTLAEIPEVEGDVIRFMHYYRSLWEELSREWA